MPFLPSLAALCGAACALLSTVFCTAAAEDPPVFETAASVRAIALDDVKQGQRVRLEGTVLYFRPGLMGDLILQDATAAIYIRPPELPSGLALRRGERVQIEGVTFTDDFAPRVRAERIDEIGEAALPSPIAVAAGDLLSGRFEDQLVEVRGVIRSGRIAETKEQPRLILDLVADGVRIPVWILSFSPQDVTRFVDAEVSVPGICLHFVGLRMQPVGMRLVVQEIGDLHILSPPAAEPFATPLRKIDELLRFSPSAEALHRAKVAGVVSYHRPGQELFIDDGQLGLHIFSAQKSPVLAPGDRIEAIGFPVGGGMAARLEDASYRIVGKEPPHQAEDVNAARILRGDYEGRLVRLVGSVRAKFKGEASESILLDAEGHPVEVVLNDAAHSDALSELGAGWRVQVAGVCETIAGSRKVNFGIGPDTFRIFLRSPADLSVLARGPFWTARRALWLLGVLAGIAAFAGLLVCWNFALRRRVREYGETIRRQQEFETLSQERTRIARELHDTIEQHLTGIHMQLAAIEGNLPNSPESAKRLAATAREMVRHSREETRLAVWDLRGRPLNDQNLAHAIERDLRPLAQAAGMKFEVRADPQVKTLAPAVEHHLIRLAREAMTNAVKHAEATEVGVELRSADREIALTIYDNGRGLDTQNPFEKEGHFGLQGMRERAEKIGGILEIQSPPGRGVTLLIRIPLRPPEAPAH